MRIKIISSKIRIIGIKIRIKSLTGDLFRFVRLRLGPSVLGLAGGAAFAVRFCGLRFLGANAGYSIERSWQAKFASEEESFPS